MTIEERARKEAIAEICPISRAPKTRYEHGAVTLLTVFGCRLYRSAFLAGAEAMHRRAIGTLDFFGRDAMIALDPASLLSALEGEQKEAEA